MRCSTRLDRCGRRHGLQLRSLPGLRERLPDRLRRRRGDHDDLPVDSALVTRKTIGSIQLDLDQRLSAISGGSSTLTQTYRLTNTAGTGASLILARHVNGDLEFDGAPSDRGAATAAGKVLYEFDSHDDPATASTFVGISGELGSNDTPDRWTVQPFNYHDDILTTPGIPADHHGMVHDDTDGDRIVDTPFNVTMSQQWNALLAPGATVTFVTSTRFGHHPNRPPNAVDDSLVTAEDAAGSLNVCRERQP